MNTFLPFPNFAESARCLDTIRLRNQLNECRVIKSALGGAKAWAHHPATRMWADWPMALEFYTSTVAHEMRKRDLKIPAWAPEGCTGVCAMPIWLNSDDFHKSHRQNLLRKNYAHYAAYFPDEGISDVYAWPTKRLDGVWMLKFKQVGAKRYIATNEHILSG